MLGKNVHRNLTYYLVKKKNHRFRLFFFSSISSSSFSTQHQFWGRPAFSYTSPLVAIFFYIHAHIITALVFNCSFQQRWKEEIFSVFLHTFFRPGLTHLNHRWCNTNTNSCIFVPYILSSLFFVYAFSSFLWSNAPDTPNPRTTRMMVSPWKKIDRFLLVILWFSRVKQNFSYFIRKHANPIWPYSLS